MFLIEITVIENKRNREKPVIGSTDYWLLRFKLCHTQLSSILFLSNAISKHSQLSLLNQTEVSSQAYPLFF